MALTKLEKTDFVNFGGNLFKPERFINFNNLQIYKEKKKLNVSEFMWLLIDFTPIPFQAK